MFDAKKEYERAAAHADALLAVTPDTFESETSKNSHTIYGMLNYMTGVMETIACLAENTALTYEDHVIEEMIDIKKAETPFSLQEEEERARAFFNLVASEPIPDHSQDAHEHTLTLGILTGIIAALSAAQGRNLLDYSALLPNTPGDLNDN